MTTNMLRTSQLITTFGPGAMVDLPEAAVMIASLDYWRYDRSRLPIILESRLTAKLARHLGISQLVLQAPPPCLDFAPGNQKQGVDVWRFPQWFLVQNPVPVARGVRRRLVHQNALLPDLKYRDSGDKKNKEVVPIRFVRACRKGHIGDIDWPSFVHEGRTDCRRELWFEDRGIGGNLDEQFIVCDCGQERALSKAATPEFHALGHCDGSRPWLGSNSWEGCTESNRLLIRSASNAYFPQVMSVISIPDMTSPVDDVVRSLWDDFLVDVQTEDDLHKVRRKPTPAAKLQGIEDIAILQAIERVRIGEAGTERSVKDVEFDVLSSVTTHDRAFDRPEGDFFARALPSELWQSELTHGVERVLLVHRLREVVAQVGFTRFESAGPDISGELDLDVLAAPLALDANWLPAMENRGEGIFIQFKAETVAAWLQQSQVIQRGIQLQAGFELWHNDHPQSNRQFPGLPYILLHSLSHLLMNAVTLECGYPASSLRERVYAMDGRYGILIYTGTPDAEGTLGGLVLAGRDIARHLQRAIEYAFLCSNDPICSCHTPHANDPQPLNGAACHGCLLVAETSCEQRNEFLDRALVVRTVEAQGAEFFRS
ncbi:MAG: DUF1998 domain-containing protein [Magnetococcales bacterium]|nr:DUF1998 domain-containing protein [Magnetococcales bacterium]